MRITCGGGSFGSGALLHHDASSLDRFLCSWAAFEILPVRSLLPVVSPSMIIATLDVFSLIFS